MQSHDVASSYSTEVNVNSVDATMTYSPILLAARDRFCRLCLKQSDAFLIPLAAKLEHVSVMDMLDAITGLELEVNPLYPTRVCPDCMTKLDKAYGARQEFLNSAELLLKMAVEDRLPAYYGVVEDEILPEDEVDEPEVQETLKEEVDGEEVVKEKFVYSWKELVKPKRIKKERPPNALTGINRKSRADEQLLAQFPQTTCYICNTPHETLEQRDDHLNCHVPMVPHRCDDCSTDAVPVILKSVLTLNRHLLMHRMPYKCDFCFRRFISTGSQYTHVWSMHMGATDGMTCDYCGKSFTQKRSFQAHVRRHKYKTTGKFKCETCGETCGSSLLLNRHRLKHTGEKAFTCNFCGKSFSRACNLLTHKRIHTNERCHKCPDCSNAFRDSVTLRKHRERFHLGKPAPVPKVERNPFTMTDDGRKQFCCKFEGCSYTTTSNTSISRHKARHVKRYSCGDCGKRFAEPNLVRKHQEAMHSGKVRRRVTTTTTTKAETEATVKEDSELCEGENEVVVEYLDEEQLKLEYEVEVVDEKQ
ncbi:zinc finger protein 2-like [Culex pipiens pallens]|uniref:zinc finger protein 2-like n=1 Tax=Culex pipiens pallens TaxID=42434 RepID=UPI001954F361|nr:zinc finger protein 2-like [Culex pipiens pallens]